MKHLVLVSLIATLLASPAHAREHRLTKAVTKVGEGVGFAVGFAVTGALVASKKWNAPLRDAEGRVAVLQKGPHTFTLKQRHQPVLGPKILLRASRMPMGLRRAFVAGLGIGASKAPPAEGAFEFTLSRTFGP